MDDEMVAEGDLYRLAECARLALENFGLTDGFISEVVKEQGVDQVTKKFAEVIRRRCGNEASGTFTITKKQLLECYNEMRKAYFNETLENLVSKNIVKLSLDREGNVCFDPADNRQSWSEIMNIGMKREEKGGEGEPQKS